MPKFRAIKNPGNAPGKNKLSLHDVNAFYKFRFKLIKPFLMMPENEKTEADTSVCLVGIAKLEQLQLTIFIDDP